MKHILLTGGAGYIGSHVLQQLSLLPDVQVTVVDNLSTGHRRAVLFGNLVVADIGDVALMRQLFATHHFDAIMHFAGSVVVPESVQDPLKYYQNNTQNSFQLLQLLREFQSPPMIFSSTAAVYGSLEQGYASEDHPLRPESPYGRTKLMTEWMMQDLAHSTGQFRFVILRYFNVAGASMTGEIGQSTPGATHLLKVACEVATSKRPSMHLYGDDYPTPDGSCIRDFIHVDDLARAHVLALKYLLSGGSSQVLNCGYGRGHSVKEVIAMAQRLSGRDFPVVRSARRAGDCPVVVSQAEKIKQVLGWAPQHDNLETIVASALKWEKSI